MLLKNSLELVMLSYINVNGIIKGLNAWRRVIDIQK